MFDKVCIKAPEQKSHSLVFDPGFFCETLLFYQKVTLLADEQILVKVFSYCTIQGIKRLIKNGLLDIYIREDIVGPMCFPINEQKGIFRYNIDRFTSNQLSYNIILYRAFYTITKDINKSISLTDEFLPLVKRHQYPQDLINQITSDLEDKIYLQQSASTFFNHEFPDLNISPYNISIEIVKDDDWNGLPSYDVITNLPIEKIKQAYKLKYNNTPNEIISGFLLNIAETRGDIQISSQLNSEIATEEILAKLMRIKFDSLYQKFDKSQGNIFLFNEKILPNYYSIREAIWNKKLKFHEFLKILEKANKFKSWLKEKPHDENLVIEYYQAISKETGMDKLPAKIARFFILEISGPLIDIFSAGSSGGIITKGLSIADTFLIDKIAKGWRPNQFINNNLKKNLPKKI